MNSDKKNAIISHLTIIGTIVSIVLNQTNKSESVSFYNRQTLGIFIFFHLGSLFIYNLNNWLFSGAFYAINSILVLYSFWGVVQNQRKLVPIIGSFFQDNFKNI